DDAYLIFETLNTRGKDLATSDLVKNLLTKLLKQKGAEVDAAKEKWNRVRKLIQESSEDLSLDIFIHHYWLSKHGYVALNKLFPTIREKIQAEGDDSSAKAKILLDDLVRQAPHYRSL